MQAHAFRHSRYGYESYAPEFLRKCFGGIE